MARAFLKAHSSSSMATAGPWTSLRPPLLPPLLETVLHRLNHPTMTPVQSASISPLLTSKDVVVQAETGSGKTLSFLIPTAQMILQKRRKPSRRMHTLIIVPTRELANQVHSVAVELFRHLPGDIEPVSLIGGASTAGPDEACSDHRVVIATPGRLAAALEASCLNVSQLEMLIMDEADRLLDMGFSVTLTTILTRLPRQRRTGIYSATQTAAVDELARAGMRNPVRVVIRVATRDGDGGEETEKRRVPASLKCFYDMTERGERLARLFEVLVKRPGKTIVYLLTCACVEYYRRLPLGKMLAEAYEKAGVEPSERAFVTLHGKLSQKRRESALKRFTEAADAVLLCTDVAARGIDIPDVDNVIQFDAPQDPDAYIHRVGRTARLGRDGTAIIFLAESEQAYVDFLQVRKCPVEEMKAQRIEGFSTVVDKYVRDATMADRAILDSCEAAFLSYIRAYREHRCRYLLKLEDININSIADSFGLLRFPRFYEFKKFRGQIRRRGEGVVIKEVPYKDKKREQKRRNDIAEAITNRVERKEALVAKSKKQRKRKHRDGKKTQDSEEPDGRGAHSAGILDDGEEDFTLEAMQLRKLKRGKLSREAFDNMTGYLE